MRHWHRHVTPCPYVQCHSCSSQTCVRPTSTCVIFMDLYGWHSRPNWDICNANCTVVNFLKFSLSLIWYEEWYKNGEKFQELSSPLISCTTRLPSNVLKANQLQVLSSRINPMDFFSTVHTSCANSIGEVFLCFSCYEVIQTCSWW